MTEATNPSPSDPAGPSAPTGGLDEGQSLLDAGSVEPADDGVRASGADVAGNSDALAPHDAGDPSTRSEGRGESAS